MPRTREGICSVSEGGSRDVCEGRSGGACEGGVCEGDTMQMQAYTCIS